MIFRNGHPGGSVIDSSCHVPKLKAFQEELFQKETLGRVIQLIKTYRADCQLRHQLVEFGVNRLLLFKIQKKIIVSSLFIWHHIVLFSHSIIDTF